MLSLKNIVKDYVTGDETVKALKGVDIEFRESEFVSILGPSGCGKTTLLNIIGGLDRYTSGDLVINGRSTKEYKDSDWDSYRNHSIGFVFQSYNLIPHQTVLSNVELALTLSGVSKSERRQRAIDVLKQVGLGDQLNKKPNQMSGGQMQRVAIARALVNDPDILLADEPTGALDSATSVQIMEILKNISKDKLIIMVTHNPELAEKYSSRIIRLLDGKVTDDSDPYSANVVEPIPDEKKQKSEKKKTKKTSMSFTTALSLSRNNLLTKKARTLLTSFAGSIGIIGIALILSLSNGVQTYIDQVQEDTLSSYPLTITETSTDVTRMMQAMAETRDSEPDRPLDKIYSGDRMSEMLNIMLSETTHNNMSAFKEYLESSDIKDYTSDIQYGYTTQMNVYRADTENGLLQVNPTQVYEKMGFGGQMGDMYSSMASFTVWTEMIGNMDIINSQYDVIAGHMPEKPEEIAVVVNKYNELDDFALYTLGLKDQDALADIMRAVMNGETFENPKMEFSYDDILSLEYKLILNTDYYKKSGNKWVDMSDNEAYMKEKVDNGITLKVVGIIRPNEEASASSISGSIAYRHDLMELLINKVNDSEIVKEQKASPDINVFTGEKFTKESINAPTAAPSESAVMADSEVKTDTADTSSAADGDVTSDNSQAETAVPTREQLLAAMGYDTLPDEMKAQLDAMTDEELLAAAQQAGAGTADTSSAADSDVTSDNSQAETAAPTREQLLAALGYDTLPDEMKAQLDAMTDEELLAAAQQAGAGTAETPSAPEDKPQGGTESGSADIPSREELLAGIDLDSLTDEQKAMLDGLSDEELAALLQSMGGASSDDNADNTYDDNMLLLGVSDLNDPSNINIYPKDFAAKEKITELIDEYNKGAAEEDVIQYTDMVGLMMSSVTSIIDAISYILIAFVAISLIVSSIMIGIITYISVLERTKEIGILRSIGASKKDISRVFNAETLIVGFVAGAMGIIISYLLTIPINMIIDHVTDVPMRAAIPVVGAVILIVISMLLTLIAGLFPSRIAAKKDPVIALRTE